MQNDFGNMWIWFSISESGSYWNLQGFQIHSIGNWYLYRYYLEDFRCKLNWSVPVIWQDTATFVLLQSDTFYNHVKQSKFFECQCGGLIIKCSFDHHLRHHYRSNFIYSDNYALNSQINYLGIYQLFQPAITSNIGFDDGCA